MFNIFTARHQKTERSENSIIKIDAEKLSEIIHKCDSKTDIIGCMGHVPKEGKMHEIGVGRMEIMKLIHTMDEKFQFTIVGAHDNRRESRFHTKIGSEISQIQISLQHLLDSGVSADNLNIHTPKGHWVNDSITEIMSYIMLLAEDEEKQNLYIGTSEWHIRTIQIKNLLLDIVRFVSSENLYNLRVEHFEHPAIAILGHYSVLLSQELGFPVDLLSKNFGFLKSLQNIKSQQKEIHFFSLQQKNDKEEQDLIFQENKGIQDLARGVYKSPLRDLSQYEKTGKIKGISQWLPIVLNEFRDPEMRKKKANFDSCAIYEQLQEIGINLENRKTLNRSSDYESMYNIKDSEIGPKLFSWLPAYLSHIKQS